MAHHPASNRKGIAGLLRGPLILSLLFLVPGAPPAAAQMPSSPPDGGKSSEPGHLMGVISVGPELTARKIDFQLYADVKRQAAERSTPTLQEEIRNIVVYLEPEIPFRWSSASPASKHVMQQAKESFEPHVLPILAGSTVDFPNFDPFFHNVFSLSLASGFDLGHYPRGQSRSVTFDKPGIVKVFCHLHADMSAVILVLDTPFFIIPDREGAYAIRGIPPGRYMVKVWHERAKPVSRAIRIEPGQSASASFHVPISEAASGE